MSSIENVKLGPCDLIVDGVNVGHTKEGSELNYEPEFHDVTVDKYGNTIAEKVLVGEMVSVKVKIAESTLANLKVAMPLGAIVSAKRITFGSDAGVRMGASAKAVVLHPQGETTNAADVVLYKAISSEPIAVPYKIDEERAFEVTFTALIDETKSNGNRLFMIGDST
jgi:hypothetical protein